MSKIDKIDKIDKEDKETILLMEEGYREMAEENKLIAEEFYGLQAEVIALIDADTGELLKGVSTQKE